MPQAVGDRVANLATAVAAISSHPGHDVPSMSVLVESGKCTQTSRSVLDDSGN
jgi:hypothetical protein